MKILLYEKLPTKLKFDFGEGFDTFTARDMNRLAKKNGKLPGLAVFHDLNILLT